MTNIDLGTTGAKRATWREKNPRELLMEIIDANPRMKGQDKDQWERRIGDLFWQAAQDDLETADDRNGTYLNVLCQWWLANSMRSLLGPSLEEKEARRKKKEENSKKVNEAADRIKENVKTEIERRAKVLLLDLTTPNGKQLRDCDRFDCRSFGGWYAELAKRIPGKKTIGEVFNEDNLHALWNKYAVRKS